MSRTDTPPDASASRVIAPTSSYCCPGPKPAALWPMRQGWSSTRGLVPRAGESGRLLHRGGMDTQTGSGARTWALRLSGGVVVEAAEKALCDRLSSLVRMVRSPWGVPLTFPPALPKRRLLALRILSARHCSPYTIQPRKGYVCNGTGLTRS